MAGLYAALLAVIALATWNPGAPVLLLGGLATAAGACTPPLGPVMRALWSSLVPDRELLQRAYSLDGVAEELMYVTAPLLVGIVVTFTVPHGRCPGRCGARVRGGVGTRVVPRGVPHA